MNGVLLIDELPGHHVVKLGLLGLIAFLFRCAWDATEFVPYWHKDADNPCFMYIYLF